MSISIDLKPEIEERLEQESAAGDVSVESYVKELLEQQVFQPDKFYHAGAEEIDHALDALAEGSEHRTVLPS